MENYQPGILQPLPEQAVYLTCNLDRSASLEQVIQVLQTLDTDNNVVAIGQSFLDRFNQSVPDMRAMPASASQHIGAATATDLWCWIRGDDRGELLHRSRRIIRHLGPVFDLVDTTDAFQYAGGRDLTGCEDGTENPVVDAAIEAVILSSDNAAINGSSFVAVQQWQHDLGKFDTLPGADDGIEDGLFQFSHVLNSAYNWCPPVSQGKLNLAAIDQ